MIGSLRVEDPPASAPTPRAHALAILENFHSNLRATPAMAILGSLLAEEERHPELLGLFKTRLVEPRRALLRQALAAGDLPDSPTSTHSPACSSAPSTAATSPPPASPTTGRTVCSAPYGHPTPAPRHRAMITIRDRDSQAEPEPPEERQRAITHFYMALGLLQPDGLADALVWPLRPPDFYRSPVASPVSRSGGVRSFGERRRLQLVSDRCTGPARLARPGTKL